MVVLLSVSSCDMLNWFALEGLGLGPDTLDFSGADQTTAVKV